MDSPPGDAFHKVKEEQQESHHEGSFPKVSEEEEERPRDSFAQVKKEDEFTQSGSACCLGNALHEPQNDLQDEEEEADDDMIIEDEDDQSYEFASTFSNQVVVCDTGMNSSGQFKPFPMSTEYQPPPFSSYRQNPPSRVLLTVLAYTVQCANCFKWRLIPTKETYEKIRENILQQPFVCDSAREWRPDITCEDPADIDQDNSRFWVIDKPNIAQPPPGWERLLAIRSEGCTKFADVYYVPPSGKKLRSIEEVQKYLLEHPEICPGVTVAQFSFETPEPLQTNYVRKSVPVPSAFNSAEPSEVNPLSGSGPVENTEFQIPEQGGLSNSFNEAHIPSPSTIAKETKNNIDNQTNI